MSFFGKNIKKIRTIKGLSQSAFAEIFNLKRATLGAYEELRSEPKIETIIKIANHFSITIDTLLTSDITVNKLLKFKEDLTTEYKNAKQEQFTQIPCILENTVTDYVSQFKNKVYLNEMPCIKLPINTSKVLRAFTISNLEMTNKEKGFYPKDIVIGEQIATNLIQEISNGSLVFAIVKDNLIFRRIYITNDKIVFRADHKNIKDKTFEKSDIKELWKVCFVFCNRIPDFSSSFDDKIQSIEQEILEIKARLN